VARRRRDVEERQLVGTLRVVPRGELDRVARVAQVLEVHALDDASGVDVEAGDHADRHGHEDSPWSAGASPVVSVPAPSVPSGTASSVTGNWASRMSTT